MSEPNGGSVPGVRPPDTAALSVEGYTFGAFRIDLAHRQLFREGQPLTVGLKAFDTLVLLVKHRDRVVGKDEIISAVWPDSFVSRTRRSAGSRRTRPTYATCCRAELRYGAAAGAAFN